MVTFIKKYVEFYEKDICTCTTSISRPAIELSGHILQIGDNYTLDTCFANMNIRKLLCKMIVYSFDSIILFCCYDFFFLFFFREISLDRFWHISQLINVFRFSSLSDLVMLWSLIVCSFLSILLLCLFCMITFNITLEMILIMFWMNLGLFDGWNRTEILLGYWLIVPIFGLLILYSFVLLW